MVFSDPDGTLTYFNPAFQQVVDAIVGRPVGIGTEVTTAHRIREVLTEHIEDPEGYWEAVRESLESAGPCVHVFRVPRIDRWFARLATRVRDEDGEPLGLLVLVRDVTAERATEREASITRQVIEASPDGIMLLDAESHALMTNRRMDELMTEILGSPTSMSQFTTADDWSERVAARMEDPERFLREIRELRQDPTSHPMVEFRVAATDATYQRFVRPISGPDGEIIGTVRLLRDMTAERAAERAKDDLMAAVSHELRTPLASILGFAELLETRQLDEAVQRRYAGTIHQEARRLTALVDDLIDLRLVEEGRLALSTEPVDVGELVREQAALFARRADRHSIDVDVADGPLIAQADRLRLAQVFSNLMSNAIKYSPDGGAVRVGATSDNGSVRVFVSDEGIGIPLALQSRLFERFFRADRPSIRHIGGSGIGLALTRELVHALGGEIGFESAEGSGSTFWVDLPLSTA
jgi:signal transduction histidine kinase